MPAKIDLHFVWGSSRWLKYISCFQNHGQYDRPCTTMASSELLDGSSDWSSEWIVTCSDRSSGSIFVPSYSPFCISKEIVIPSIAAQALSTGRESSLLDPADEMRDKCERNSMQPCIVPTIRDFDRTLQRLLLIPWRRDLDLTQLPVAVSWISELMSSGPCNIVIPPFLLDVTFTWWLTMRRQDLPSSS